MDEAKEGLMQFQSSVQLAVNKTYTYNNQASLFCALVPSYIKDYADRYVKPCCQWVDGYVPEIHNDGSGIVSTRIATALIQGMAKQVVGEKPIFKNASSKDCPSGDGVVSYCYKIAKEGNFRQAMFAAVAFAMTTGTSLLKLNATAYHEPWWEAVRLDNCYFLSDFRGRVQDAYFYVRSYADTRPNRQNESFYLVEHRFWLKWETAKIVLNANDEENPYHVARKKGQLVPMVSYEVYRMKGTALNKVDAPNQFGHGVSWQELPTFMRKALRDDYGALMVGIPQELPFLDLGVVVCKDGELDISVPTAQCFGKSKIMDVQSDLINYEIGNSYRLRDAYLGKGTLYLPKSMSLGDLNNPNMPSAYGGSVLNALPDSPIALMKGVDSDSQQAIVKQFELRIAEWQKMCDDALKAIATKWGTTPKALSSYLAQGEAQQTATQIDSEDDMSIAFIEQERSYFIEPFNKLLETTLNFCGKEALAEVSFGNPSLVNKDRLLARTEKEYEMGLIDIEQAVRQTNPDLDEKALRMRIDKAMNRQAEIQAQSQMPMDGSDLDGMSEPHNNLTDGVDADELFADNEEDNGGNNLRGTTNPTQKQGYENIF